MHDERKQLRLIVQCSNKLIISLQKLIRMLVTKQSKHDMCAMFYLLPFISLVTMSKYIRYNQCRWQQIFESNLN